MGARTSGREAALQMLFAVDLANHSSERVVRDFWRELPGDAEGRAYADELVKGVVGARDQLDEQITKAASNWRLERMTPVDRNILRLGAFELDARRDIPTEVILDEAVELAKRFAADNGARFVNGVLDRLAKDIRVPS